MVGVGVGIGCEAVAFFLLAVVEVDFLGCFLAGISATAAASCI
jgi:hypothetical protein